MSWSAKYRAMSMAVATALALAGCTSGSDASSPTRTPAPPTGAAGTGPTTAPAGPQDVPDTLRFSAPMVGGGRFEASTLAGKPAVLWFWAAWCPRCRAKAGDVRSAQSAHADTVNFVGVAGLGSGSQAMERFVTDHDLAAFPHLADDDGVVWRRFGVSQQEFFVILDRSGAVVYQGPLGADDLVRRVEALGG